MSRKNFLKTMQWGKMAALFQIVIGCAVGGAAYPLFLTPGDIAPGGLTGVAMLLHELIPALPVGTTSLVMNIPLFIVGYRAMGRRFAARSLGATVLFSLAIDLMPLQALTTDPMLSGIFGGVMLGVGLGLILRGGATTGGTDMAARLVHQKLPFISTGMFLLGIDCLVVLAAAFVFDQEKALYALISIAISSKMIDVVMLGLTQNKACFVMSEGWETISRRVLTEMDRGATLLTAKGAYSGMERPVILCVLPVQEVATFKNIVRQEDEKAFMFITEAHEALGEGFDKLMEKE